MDPADPYKSAILRIGTQADLRVER
jgi:hypothetical protein